MTKNERIKALERQIKELRSEITQLRRERFVDARPPIYPYVASWVKRRRIDDPERAPWWDNPMSPRLDPNTTAAPIELHRYERTIPTDDPFVVMMEKR